MAKLTISLVAEDGQTMELALKGSLDSTNYMELSGFLSKSHIGAPRSLILDLSGVDHVGSSGWIILFVQASQLERVNKHLVLAGMNDHVAHSLAMVMPKKGLLDIAEDIAAAKTLIQARNTPEK